jgi:uncharacterized cupredoxin-like copper-binding protein
MPVQMTMSKWTRCGSAVALLFAAAAPGAAAQDFAFGSASDPATATRIIDIVMRDNYFEPEAVEVQAGETVRFALTNEGELLHQFTLGPVEFHVQQQEEMAMMAEHGMLTATGIDPSMTGMDHGGMAMTHEGPNTVLVAPGETAELTWRVGQPAELEFACNLPGHYEAGMAGPVSFE